MDLLGQEYNNAPKPKSKGKKVVLNLLIVSIILLVVVIALIYLLKGSQPKKASLYVNNESKTVIDIIWSFSPAPPKSNANSGEKIAKIIAINTEPTNPIIWVNLNDSRIVSLLRAPNNAPKILIEPVPNPTGIITPILINLHTVV